MRKYVLNECSVPKIVKITIKPVSGLYFGICLELPYDKWFKSHKGDVLTIDKFEHIANVAGLPAGKNDTGRFKGDTLRKLIKIV